jgi:isopentenyl-diphosphate delta-isomerase
MDYVVLVDEADVEHGVMEKMEAHQKGLLHRAFSIFLFNEKGHMLVHQRAQGKYHCPGLWTNACCSHPRPSESDSAAAQRRLAEELGLQTELTEQLAFTYHAVFDNGLTEYEYDHVFFGQYDGEVPFNAQEVMAVKWVSWSDLEQWITNEPEAFTPWFKIALPLVKEKIKTKE